MSLFDDGRVKKTADHEMGQDLSLLSADELCVRITLLRAEIERIETERGKRTDSRTAAESLFR